MVLLCSIEFFFWWWFHTHEQFGTVKDSFKLPFKFLSNVSILFIWKFSFTMVIAQYFFEDDVGKRDWVLGFFQFS